jgi:hypothetical protein
MPSENLRIGCGAGFARDRIEPAIELVREGDIDYLVFECLAERTIALDQLDRISDPNKGYNAGLEFRLSAVLPLCARKGIKVITNMGSANPEAAALQVASLCRNLNIPGLKIAAILGDNVTDLVREVKATIIETGDELDVIRGKIVSANAYLGAEPIVEALGQGADVVITGRSADPSLFLGPMMHEFGWSADGWHRLGSGTVLGHLMECGGQITGGYFADPGYKDVPGLAHLGFPICEVRRDGEGVITKVAGSGGQITLATCKEQMLYEIHDPAHYVTPDVVADFTDVEFVEVGPNRIEVKGGTGRKRTDFYKVSVGYRDSFIGEGQMSYAGPGAIERARLAVNIVKERLLIQGLVADEMRIDLIGIDSIHGPVLQPSRDQAPYELRIRVACRTGSASEASKVGMEVATLLTNGPAGGAADFASVREIIGILSILLPRETVKPKVVFV